MPDLYPCEIKLTQDGGPLADATILLMSDDSSLIRWPVAGKTDESGVAQIATRGKFKGAPAGTFAVVVVKDERDPTDPNVDPMTTASGPTEFYSLVELKYETKETTPLSATVEAKGGNKFEFDCGAKVRVLRSNGGI